MNRRVLAVVLFLGLPAVAHAEPVNLICRVHNADPRVADGSPTPVTFDAAAGTAAFDTNPASPAKITDAEVTWDYTFEVNNARYSFTLNRVTAELHVHSSRADQTYRCTVAHKQF
jgi:hypothetical protein